MVKHTQTIRPQFADEFFESVRPFCEIVAYYQFSNSGFMSSISIANN